MGGECGASNRHQLLASAARRARTVGEYAAPRKRKSEQVTAAAEG